MDFFAAGACTGAGAGVGGGAVALRGFAGAKLKLTSAVTW